MAGLFVLLLTALIWGAAFVAQKLGMDHVGPFAFTLYRNILAGLFLLGVLKLRDLRTGAGHFFSAHFGRKELRGGAWCGLALWIPSMLQQIGIQDTSPGTCAFLTANYALLVPVLGLFLGRRVRPHVWAGVLVAMVGTFLICLKSSGEFALGKGEALTLLCAFGYAIQIFVVDRHVPGSDVVGLSCVQFFIAAALGLPFLLLPSERALLDWNHVRLAIGAIAYCGILSSGVAYTLQNVGQKLVAPAIAALLLSLESVFGVFFGWLAGKEEMTARRLVGYALVFLAIAFTQILEARKPSSK